ncbi:diguanylate cyclase [Halomonas sp. IOP_14]|uniref:sensor domain-containing diguanylate cyclase n=1 Tax=Halomonadaceae TaxID=28256 RepID=UPI001142502F|nr:MULTISPECIES: diguanylate cyclase [Halomonas]MCD1587761.1 diguanylate cyclase [Halomonas sp. IOP_14]
MPAPFSPDAPSLLNALAVGSRALIDAHFWSEGVDQLLAALGEASGVNRVWIFQTIERNPNGVLQDFVFEWASSSHYRERTQKRFRFFTTLIDDLEYEEMVNRRERGDSHTCITSQVDLGSLRDNLESQSILSMVTVPIMVDGQWWGTLGFDDCEREVDWEGAGLQALVIGAELIASAIYRQQLTRRQRQVDLLQQVAACGTWEINTRSGATWCSSALLLSLGYPGDYARLPLRRLLAHAMPTDRIRVFGLIRECQQRLQTQCRIDVQLRVASGQWRWHELVMESYYSDDGYLARIGGLVIDISQRKKSEEQAWAAAEFDALTGTRNRRGLANHLAQLNEQAEAAAYYLLMIDIDYFKHINDRYGHPAGDTLLVEMAKRVHEALRPEDCLARFGGEEFAVTAGDLSHQQVVQLGERIRQRVAQQPFYLTAGDSQAPMMVTLTVSVGIAPLALTSDLDHSQAVAVAQADQALYAAKEAGRNRVVAHWQP